MKRILLSLILPIIGPCMGSRGHWSLYSPLLVLAWGYGVCSWLTGRLCWSSGANQGQVPFLSLPLTFLGFEPKIS